VKTSPAALEQQHGLSVALPDAIVEAGKLAADARERGMTDFAGAEGFGGIAGSHQQVINALQGSDSPPTDAMVEAASERLSAWAALQARWAKARGAP
jgi:hypothetical protein